ncbi:MAG: 5-(carboxyamino)imidazole ribonucleotide synthase [Bacteroidales bacterium]|nr:5-(carboxyamino)imidazole ribonucleotide synthase [Bacteroidales bacterium]
MENLSYGKLKLGIIAGGQLAKMLIQEASKWDIATYVLDQEEDCPAGQIATCFIRGSRFDYNAVYQFGKQVDILTYEIESINVDALYQLQSEGLQLYPDPSILELIQDKGKQKDYYWQHSFPTAPYTHYSSKAEILMAIEQRKLKYPFVQKQCKEGYDGRGVAVINSQSDLQKLLDSPSIVEQKVDIDKEISVIVARNVVGEVKCFPAVEMVFEPNANLVDKLICPANIPDKIALEAENIAKKLIESLDMVGLLAIEFFLDKNQQLYINECAPRPHNSGHHTIESTLTSQYEQHLRAILNLPLGSTRILKPAVMVNLLGEPGVQGPVKYEGLKEALAIEGVKIHLYGKKQTRGYRKMGHVTIVADTVDEANTKAEQVKKLLKVTSCSKI